MAESSSRHAVVAACVYGYKQQRTCVLIGALDRPQQQTKECKQLWFDGKEGKENKGIVWSTLVLTRTLERRLRAQVNDTSNGAF